MSRLKTFFLLLTTIATIFSKAQTVEKFPKSSINAHGYVVAKPIGTPTEGLPCIIHLHGTGGMGDGSDNNLDRIVNGELPKYLQKAAEKYKMVVIAPQVKDWNYNSAIAYVRSIAMGTYKVDSDKIHLWGLSAGGSGVTGYVSSSVSNASQFATAVVSCGAGTVSTSGARNIGDAKLPMIFFHAEGDQTVGVLNTNTSVTNINNYAASFKAKKVIYSGSDHGIWDRVYNPDVWPWLGNESQGLYEWALSTTRGNPKPVPEIIPSVELVVEAGPDLTTSTGKVRLDGTAGTKNWKTAKWTCVSAPSGVNLWNVSACGWILCENVSLTVQGEYLFELKCTDAQGAAKADTIKVTYSGGTTPPIPTKTIIARLFVNGFEVIVYSDKTAEVK